MEDIRRRPGASLLNVMIKFRLIPFGELLWLVLRQAGLHWKVRARQVQSALQVGNFGHILDSGKTRPRRNGGGRDSIPLYYLTCTAILETVFLVVTQECYNGFGGVSAVCRRASIPATGES